MKALLLRAYQLKAYQVIGPNWLESERYDIVAKLPTGATQNEVPAMLHTLLAERFAIRTRYETREIPAYLLVVSKGGLRMPVFSGDTSGVRASLGGRVHHVRGQVSVRNLINLISGSVDRPIIDSTGLSAVYEIDLEWASDQIPVLDGQPAQDIPAPDLFVALQRQVGLRLEPHKTATEVLVVDHAEHVPTGN